MNVQDKSMWAWVKLRSRAALVRAGRLDTGHPGMTEGGQLLQLAAVGNAEGWR